MNLYNTVVSGAPQEYVADVVDTRNLPVATNSGSDAAIDAVLSYLDSRISAVLDRDSRRPSVMLSGGIDSVLLAARVAHYRPDALLVTVHFDSPGAATGEVDTARGVATELGLDHEVVVLDPKNTGRLAQKAVNALGTSDLWEVLAAAVLLAADETARAQGADGAIFTGAGADALFLGGEMGHSSGEWHERVLDKVHAHFIRERAIPDFYERLLSEPDRHIQVWQTIAATELALALTAEDVRGPDLETDKWVLRQAAIRAGVPEELTVRKKDPMQLSSGGVQALVWAARNELAADPVHSTYADPLTEPLEHTAARLWLEGKNR